MYFTLWVIIQRTSYSVAPTVRAPPAGPGVPSTRPSLCPRADIRSTLLLSDTVSGSWLSGVSYPGLDPPFLPGPDSCLENGVRSPGLGAVWALLLHPLSCLSEGPMCGPALHAPWSLTVPPASLSPRDAGQELPPTSPAPLQHPGSFQPSWLAPSQGTHLPRGGGVLTRK